MKRSTKRWLGAIVVLLVVESSGGGVALVAVDVSRHEQVRLGEADNGDRNPKGQQQ